MSESRIVMTNEPLSKQVARLEEQHQEVAERAKQYEGFLSAKHDRIGELVEENRHLQAERDELKRDALEWRQLCEMFAFEEAPGNVVVLDVFKAIESDANNGIPRVITADELRHGMIVAVAHEGQHGPRWEASMALDSNISAFTDKRQIILLEEAPEPAEPEVTAETIRNSEPGSTWEDAEGDVHEWDGYRLRLHLPFDRLGEFVDYSEGSYFEECSPFTRSSVPPRGDYPKRLTVEDLDAAEVGSVLRLGGLTSKKREDGWGRLGASAEQMITASAIGWSRATLTPPEKPERRGEVIQPGELREGDVYDLYDGDGELIVAECRASKGDYTGKFGVRDEIRLVHRPKPELPTEPGSVVLVTEFDDLYTATSTEPIYAYMHEGDWYRIDGKDWPGDYGYKEARADQITGFKNARIVVEDGA